jgi:hypothetical protein
MSYLLTEHAAACQCDAYRSVWCRDVWVPLTDTVALYNVAHQETLRFQSDTLYVPLGRKWSTEEQTRESSTYYESTQIPMLRKV